MTKRNYGKENVIGMQHVQNIKLGVLNQCFSSDGDSRINSDGDVRRNIKKRIHIFDLWALLPARLNWQDDFLVAIHVPRQ